jgi:hypothetical protein
MTTAAKALWTIVAVAADGDEAQLEESEHGSLHQLLDRAVHRLYGDHAKPGDYEVLIQGAVQTDLAISLKKAGLRDQAEVVVQPKDVSKG